MAIYRTGTASLAANGVVIGVGTKWQDKLSLIRVGATIMFPAVVGAIGTISAIVSDTELRVMTTNGAVVPAGSQYVILLHDSITVDGLAQDVAETLRYYQSKETEIAEAIEFFKTFDFETLKNTADQVKADAVSANSSKVAAAGSATAAANSATAAKTSETNAKTSETAANASKLAAAASQVAAKTSETNAKTSETNAKTSETNALASKNAAAASQTAALASQNAAKTSETNAKASETASKTSETNAKASETAALASKNAAAASQTAAKTSETNSKTSETNAKASELKAKDYADQVNPANLAQLDRTNVFEAAQTFKKGMTIGASFADSLVLESANPTIKFRETDNSAGQYALVFDGGNFRMQRESDGMSLLSFARAGSDGYFTMTELSLTRKLSVSNGGTGSNTALGARDNLGLGKSDSVSFREMFLTGDFITQRNSDDALPAGAIISRKYKADGTTITSSAELRADGDGSVKLISRGPDNTPRSLEINRSNQVVFNGLSFCPDTIELGKVGAAKTSLINFHYDGSKGYSYDGLIQCVGVTDDTAGGGYGIMEFNAGRFSFNPKVELAVNDAPVVVNTAGSGVILKSPIVNKKVQLVFQDANKNYGWIGLADDDSNLMAINNSQTSTNIRIGNTRYYMQGTAEIDSIDLMKGSLYIKATSTANAHVWFKNAENDRNRAVIYSGTAQLLNFRSDNSSTGASGQQMSFNGATGECRATTFTNTSDARAKFWRKKLTGALDKICQINGETFSMHTTIQDTVRKAGLIAQDVQKVLPEAVMTGSGVTGIIDKDCNEITDPLALDYNSLSALYVEAIKELKGQVDELKDEIELLKSK